jgi:hypothetical protein
VAFPDWNSRVNAVKTLLDQGFGRPTEVKKEEASYEAFMRSLREVPDEQLEAWLSDRSDHELWMASGRPHDARDMFEGA